MGLDATLEVITPNGSELVFEFSKGASVIHHLIVSVVSKNNEGLRKIILERNECKFNLEQAFAIQDALGDLCSNGVNKEYVLDQLGLEGKMREYTSNIESYSKNFSDVLIEMFENVYLGNLDIMFIYFEYSFSS